MKTQINFEQLQNDLYYAVRDHNFVQIQSLISQGANVNGLIPILGINDNLLAFACRDSNGLEVVKLLIKNHANVNNANPESPSSCPLTQAAMSSFEITKFLIESGAEINPNIPFYSPLLLAVDVGQDINTVKLLIEKGANINELQSSFGRTALHAALRSSKFEMAKILIQNGANINIREHGESAVDLLERFANNNTQAQELFELISQDPSYITQTTTTVSFLTHTHVDVTAINIGHQPIPLQIPIEEVSGPKKPDHYIYSHKIKQSSPYYREQIKITNTDYDKIVSKIGASAPSGAKVKILKNGYKYVCTFKQEAKNLDFSKNENITEIPNSNYDNTVQIFSKTGIIGAHLIVEAENYQHQDLQAKFFDHCLKHGQQSYKYNSFIVRSQQQVRDESDSQGNIPEIEKKSETYFKDGKIYFTWNNQPINPEITYFFNLSKEGKLYLASCDTIPETNHIHHSYLRKSSVDSPLFGYGIENACAGYIEGSADSKIKSMNNSTGHYASTIDQLKLAVNYFKQFNILVEDFAIKDYENNNIPLDNINIAGLLEQHKELPELMDMLDSQDLYNSQELELIGVLELL